MNQKQLYSIVADDEPLPRKFNKRLLQQLGFIVYTAEHGQEAHEKLKELKEQGNDISVLVTDMHMPVMDGAELTKETNSVLVWTTGLRF